MNSKPAPDQLLLQTLHHVNDRYAAACDIARRWTPEPNLSTNEVESTGKVLQLLHQTAAFERELQPLRHAWERSGRPALAAVRQATIGPTEKLQELLKLVNTHLGHLRSAQERLRPALDGSAQAHTAHRAYGRAAVELHR
jgi:hypothetical protein